jgi:hypothetical protein
VGEIVAGAALLAALARLDQLAVCEHHLETVVITVKNKTVSVAALWRPKSEALSG